MTLANAGGRLIRPTQGIVMFALSLRGPLPLAPARTASSPPEQTAARHPRSRPLAYRSGRFPTAWTS